MPYLQTKHETLVTSPSRIYEGQHWFSDILLGSALGIAYAESVIKFYPKIKKASHSARLHILNTLLSISICKLPACKDLPL